MRKNRFLLLIMSLMFFLSSCMSTRLVSKYDNDSVVPNKVTKVNFLWGLLAPKDVLSGCESETMCEVRNNTNFGYILISAATLGIVVPQEMEYYCCPSVVPEEEIN